MSPDQGILVPHYLYLYTLNFAGIKFCMYLKFVCLSFFSNKRLSGDVTNFTSAGKPPMFWSKKTYNISWMLLDDI